MSSQTQETSPTTRRVAWVRASEVPPIETGEAILERKGVLAPMQPGAPPFLLLGEDRFVRGAFPLHPHQGIETVTYVVSGALEHADTQGKKAIVEAGGVQWMTAGRGIQHSEEPINDTPVHGFQLWLDLPHHLKGCEPGLQMAQAHDQARLDLSGGSVRVAAGTIGGVTGPITTRQAATMAVLELEPNADLRLDIDPKQALLLFVRRGNADVLGTAVPADHGAYLEAGEGALRIHTEEATEMLLYGAMPRAT